MLAAYHGHAPLVSLLLSHGADPNRLNDRGQSPLAGAVLKNEKAVIEALVRGFADPDFGAPSATEAVKLFKLGEEWDKVFDEAREKLRARAQSTGEVKRECGTQWKEDEPSNVLNFDWQERLPKFKKLEVLPRFCIWLKASKYTRLLPQN